MHGCCIDQWQHERIKKIRDDPATERPDAYDNIETTIHFHAGPVPKTNVEKDDDEHATAWNEAV